MVLKEMTSYLAAEKQESLLFIFVGIIAIGVASWLWMNGHRLKAIAFPLVAIAAIQLVVGSTVYLRTDTQIATLTDQLATVPQQFKRSEAQRMQVAMENFKLYKTLEIALLVVGLLLVLLLQTSDFAIGFGAGLLIQSAFMLCLDIFAETRGGEYLKALQVFAS